MSLLNERPASGTKGCLLWLLGKGEGPVFRVYNHPPEYRVEQTRCRERGEPYDKNAWVYKDYRVAHYDVDIIIDDESAALYDTEEGAGVLDYTQAAMTPSPRAVKKVISGESGSKSS